MSTPLNHSFQENLLLAYRAASLITIHGDRKDDLFMSTAGPRRLNGLIWDTLHARLSCAAMLEYSLAQGTLSLMHVDGEAKVLFGETNMEPNKPVSLDRGKLFRRLRELRALRQSSDQSQPMCLLIDAEYLFEDPNNPRDDEHFICMLLDQLARTVLPCRGLTVMLLSSAASRIPSMLRSSLFSRAVCLLGTSREERQAFVLARAGTLAERCAETPASIATALAKQTDRMPLTDVNKVIQLAEAMQLTQVKSLGDAVRAYRNGVADSPWRSSVLKDLIRQAPELLKRRIKGQDHAIEMVAQRLRDACVGLRDAATKPRMVLFISGPTGVGKTELAKALAELLFADENAMLRINCGEMQEAHSVARIVGAPPGYVGHEAGSEVVKWYQTNPLSVLLLDEIEKAHPDTWNVLLGVLSDGQIKSGNGESASLSEAVIIFTSNLGPMESYSEIDNGVARQAYRPRFTRESDFAVIRDGTHQAIKDFFSVQLGHPEYWGRIGERNLLVFDFVRDLHGIAQKFINLYIDSARSEHGLELIVPPEVVNAIVQQVQNDQGKLDYGARGLGEHVDAFFRSPLVDFIFEHDSPKGRLNVQLDALGKPRFQLERA